MWVITQHNGRGDAWLAQRDGEAGVVTREWLKAYPKWKPYVLRFKTEEAARNWLIGVVLQGKPQGTWDLEAAWKPSRHFSWEGWAIRTEGVNAVHLEGS